MQRKKNVRKLPAPHCQYYVQGRCARAESLNPGYDNRWRCTEIERIIDAYDVLLEQAETFNLDAETVKNIWENRVATMPAAGDGCPQFAMSHQDTGGPLDCVHAVDTVCLLALPLCKGICRHYTLYIPQPDTEDSHGGE